MLSFRIPSRTLCAFRAGLLLFLLSPAIAFGAAPSGILPVLSLDTVLARVEARNPELKMWEAGAQAKSAAAEGAKAWMPPEIGIGGNDLSYGPASGMAEGDPALMISARQMIPAPGRTAARARYLASLSAVDRAEGRWMRAQVLADAKSQYYRMAIVTRRLVVLAEARAVMSLMIEVAETRLKLRRGDMATVFEMKARAGELQAMQAEEESMRAQAMSALSLLMASPEQPPFSVDTAFGPPAPPSALGDTAFARRGDIAKLDVELKSMRLNLESMRLQGRPEFGIQFEHMEMPMGRRFSLMGMMTLPRAPWSSGMVRADVASMGKEIEAMRAGRDGKALMARRMLGETALMLASEADQHAKFANEIAPAYRKSLDAAMAAYQEGQGDLYRVLETWDRWLMARMGALDHLEKALVLEAEHARESGRL